MANARGVASAAGFHPEDHELIPIATPIPTLAPLLALPPPCLLTAAWGLLSISSAGDQRRTTTVLQASSELGGHHGWLSAFVD
jgi:hypothetical protein